MKNKIKSAIKSKPILSYSIVALIGCLFLNIGIFKNYAFLDAHEFIWLADINSNFKNEFITGGRFLLGIILEFVYGPLCYSISDLKWVRLFSLLGCVIFSIQVFKFLLSQKMKVYESALFSFLILTIPSFSVFYGWSATFEIPIVLNISFFAGLFLLKAFEKNKIIYCFFALILVVISLCIYQPASTAFLIPVIISFVLSKNFTIKKLLFTLLFLGISFSIYFIVFKLSLHWYDLKPTNRAKPDFIRFPFKGIRFFIRELKFLIQGSGFLIAPILFFVLGTFSFTGFLYRLYIKKTKTLEFFFLISFLILVLPLSYLPNLISADNYMCGRTIAPAAIILLFYQFIFFRAFSIENKIKNVAVLFLFTISLLFSSINLNYYISRIQNKEYSALKTALNKVPINNTKKIIFIKPKESFLQEHGFYNEEFADEFGHIASSRLWVPKPLFNQLLKERQDSLGVKKNQLPVNNIEVYNLGDKFNAENAIIISIVDVLKEEFSKD